MESDNKIVEICCGSYEDAIAAFNGGAKRIELNSALFLGGLTPSLASLILTKKNTTLKVICMVRPRGAGFCYSKLDYDVMLSDAKLLLDNNADGLAFGFLTEDKKIDINRTKEFIDLIHSYNKEAVFHRAFDCVEDPYDAIETLINLKADRILTSGLKPKAMDGINLIKDLQEKYGNKIQLLAGSGINDTNALLIMEKAKINQVHSSCKDYVEDVTTTVIKDGVKMSYAYNTNNENSYEVVSEEKVKALVSRIKRLHN